MKRCPDCGFRVKENLRDCPLCGVRMHIVPDGQNNNYVTHVHSEKERCMLPNNTPEAAVRWHREQNAPRQKKSADRPPKQEKQPASKADARGSADLAKFWIGLIVMLFFWFLESCAF